MVFAEGDPGSPALEGTIFITLHKPHGDRQMDMNVFTGDPEDMKSTYRGLPDWGEALGHPKCLCTLTRQGGEASWV